MTRMSKFEDASANLNNINVSHIHNHIILDDTPINNDSNNTGNNDIIWDDTLSNHSNDSNESINYSVETNHSNISAPNHHQTNVSNTHLSTQTQHNNTLSTPTVPVNPVTPIQTFNNNNNNNNNSNHYNNSNIISYNSRKSSRYDNLEKQVGYVKYIVYNHDPNKCYGFIGIQNRKDLHFHFDAIKYYDKFGSVNPNVGDLVQFEIFRQKNGKMKALNIYRCSYHKYKNATQNVKNNYYYNNNTYYNSNNNQYRYINNNNNSNNNYAPKNYWDKRDNFTGNNNAKYVQKNQIKNVDPALFQNNNSNNNRNIKKISSNNNVNDYMSSDNEWNDYDSEMGGSDVECCVLCGDINPEKEHKNNECKFNVGSGKFYKLQKKNVDSFYNVTHGIVSGSKLKSNIHTKLDKIVKTINGKINKINEKNFEKLSKEIVICINENECVKTVDDFELILTKIIISGIKDRKYMKLYSKLIKILSKRTRIYKTKKAYKISLNKVLVNELKKYRNGNDKEMYVNTLVLIGYLYKKGIYNDEEIFSILHSLNKCELDIYGFYELLKLVGVYIDKGNKHEQILNELLTNLYTICEVNKYTFRTLYLVEDIILTRHNKWEPLVMKYKINC